MALAHDSPPPRSLSSSPTTLPPNRRLRSLTPDIALVAAPLVSITVVGFTNDLASEPSNSPPTSHPSSPPPSVLPPTLASVTAVGLTALASLITTAVDLIAVDLTAVEPTTTSHSCAAPTTFESVSTMPDAFDKLIILLGKPDHYVKEGEGSVYVVVRVDPYGALQVKVGHTNCMDRRKNDYLRCESTGHAVYWQFHCKVEKRMLVERLIHLSFIDLNATIVRFPCPGCGTRHREYYSLDILGGLDAVEEIVQFWVWSTGGEFEKRRI